jgi:hypothetical protein
MTSRAVSIAVGVWFLGVATALGMVWSYKTKPGAHGAAPATWPAASAIHAAPGVANVVMFAHPQCPCTRASLTERGAVLSRARALPGVDIVFDRGEAEATRFGAATSGATVVYAANHALLYDGGMTVARGHEGGSAAEHIRDLVVGLTAEQQRTPVFGCALADSNPREPK